MEEQIQRNVDEEVDYNSFLETEEDVTTVEDDGLHRLASVEKKEPDYFRIPKEEMYIFETLDGEKIYVETDMSSVKWDIIRQWTDFEQFSDLSGSKVPVRKIEDNKYTIPSFDDLDEYEDIDTDNVKSLIDNGYIEYKNGEWGFSDKYYQYIGMLYTMKKEESSLHTLSWVFVAFSLFTSFFLISFLSLIVVLSSLIFNILYRYINSKDVIKSDKWLSYMYGFRDFDKQDVEELRG